jgi:hypothetical protein
MTLDDFFKQKKEAPNYVAADLGDDFSNSPLTQALKTGDPKVKVSQGRGPINVFGTVKTTAAPVEPEVAKVAQEAPKVPEVVSNEIQAKFSPSPFAGNSNPSVGMVPQNMQTTTETTTESPLNRDEYTSMVQGMMPQATWSDVLMGLIPVAADALSGGYGDALDVSGKYYSDKVSGNEKRKQSLEDKLLDMEKSRKVASVKGPTKGMFQSKNVYDKDTGKTYFINYDTSQGRYTYPDGTPISQEKLRTGFAVVPEEFNRRTDYRSEVKRQDADYLGQNTRVNPVTGELEIIRQGAATPIKLEGKAKEFNVKQEKDVEKMVSEFTKSPAYTESVNSLAITPTVTSLLNAAQRSNNPNSIAGNSVVLTMIRQAQRVGVASDRDAAAMGGTQQWSESIDRIQNKLMGSGESLTIRDIQELREISEIYKKRSQNLLRDFYGQEKKAYARRYGLTPEQIDSQLGSKVNPYMNVSEQSIKSNSLPEGVEFGGRLQYPPKENPKATVPVQMNGELFWTEPGEWDSVKKEYPNAKRLK